jgi:hypothetical protein
MFGGLFWAGFAMIVVGGWLVGSVLSRHGGLERTKTLEVIFSDESSMRTTPGDRMKFRIGAFVVCFGMMTVFSALSVGDERERRVCNDLCHYAGHASGHFAPSTVEVDAVSKLPLRACWCTTPTGSIELRPQRPPTPSAAPSR